MGLDDRTLGADRRDHQSLLHGRNIRAAKLGFDFMQLIGLSGLIVRLHQQFQGKGIMQEAVKLIISYAFNNMGFKKLYAWTHRKNTASLKLLEKNNFTRDANAEKLHAGSNELKNMLIYSLSGPGD